MSSLWLSMVVNDDVVIGDVLTMDIFVDIGFAF